MIYTTILAKAKLLNYLFLRDFLHMILNLKIQICDIKKSHNNLLS